MLLTGSVLVALGVFAISSLLRQVRRIELSENALRSSEERYALAMEGANEGHWDWNMMGGASFMSLRNKELLGRSADTPITTLEEWIARARAAGHEVLMSLAMEPIEYPRIDPGPHTLLVALEAKQNLERTQWVLSRVGGYVRR